MKKVEAMYESAHYALALADKFRDGAVYTHLTDGVAYFTIDEYLADYEVLLEEFKDYLARLDVKPTGVLRVALGMSVHHRNRFMKPPRGLKGASPDHLGYKTILVQFLEALRGMPEVLDIDDITLFSPTVRTLIVAEYLARYVKAVWTNGEVGN